jgi:hypothetical protein
MTDAPPPGPDMRDLMAEVGHVLLTWGYVEAAFRERLAKIEPTDIKPSKTPVLTRWRKAEPKTPAFVELSAEIERLAAIRNCLAHGLSSASANPWGSEEPEVVCKMPEGEVTISLSTLQEAQRGLHRASHRVRAL